MDKLYELIVTDNKNSNVTYYNSFYKNFPSQGIHYYNNSIYTIRKYIKDINNNYILTNKYIIDEYIKNIILDLNVITSNYSLKTFIEKIFKPDSLFNNLNNKIETIRIHNKWYKVTRKYIKKEKNMLKNVQIVIMKNGKEEFLNLDYKLLTYKIG